MPVTLMRDPKTGEITIQMGIIEIVPIKEVLCKCLVDDIDPISTNKDTSQIICLRKGHSVTKTNPVLNQLKPNQRYTWTCDDGTQCRTKVNDYWATPRHRPSCLYYRCEECSMDLCKKCVKIKEKIEVCSTWPSYDERRAFAESRRRKVCHTCQRKECLKYRFKESAKRELPVSSIGCMFTEEEREAFEESKRRGVCHDCQSKECLKYRMREHRRLEVPLHTIACLDESENESESDNESENGFESDNESENESEDCLDENDTITVWFSKQEIAAFAESKSKRVCHDCQSKECLKFRMREHHRRGVPLHTIDCL